MPSATISGFDAQMVIDYDFAEMVESYRRICLGTATPRDLELSKELKEKAEARRVSRARH